MILIETLTRREKIIDILRRSNHPLSISEIASILGVSDRTQVKFLYEDVFHAARSLYRNTKGREMIVMEYPRCLECGYVFKDIKKPRKPSKCPRCRSSRIMPPRFYLNKT